MIPAAQNASSQPPRLQIESENALTDEGSFVLVGNGRLYGGRFPVFKQAVIDDRLLDVIVFKRLNYVEIIRYLQNVIFTPQNTAPEVELLQFSRLRVSSEGSVTGEMNGDLI